MTPFDPSTLLIAHDRWATRRVLEVCAGLTQDQLHRRFEIGPGSLHDTLTHIVASQRRWVDFLARRPERPRLEGVTRSIADILLLHEETAADFADLAMPFADPVSGTHNGRPFTLPRGIVVSHVINHGTHHRAQCINMLRHSGISPLPNIAVREWALTAGNIPTSINA